jgi:hypothetical protein
MNVKRLSEVAGPKQGWSKVEQGRLPPSELLWSEIWVRTQGSLDDGPGMVRTHVRNEIGRQFNDLLFLQP